MKCRIATPSRTLFALPSWVASSQGYFADEGIEVELEIGGTGDQIKARLQSGQTLMSIDPPDGVLVNAAAGGTLRILAGNARKPPLFIIAQPEIKTLEDIRGKTFGVLSLREGSSKFIPKIAASVGLSPDQYRIIEVGGAPARVRCLAERTIDVALQPMPLNYQAEADGFRNLGWTGTYECDYQFTTFNADIVRLDPSLAVAVLRALWRGQQFAFANPQAVAPELAKHLGTEQHFAIQSISEAAKLGILDPDLNTSKAGLRRVADSLQEDGLLPAGFEIEKCVVSNFLEKAREPSTRLSSNSIGIWTH